MTAPRTNPDAPAALPPPDDEYDPADDDEPEWECFEDTCVCTDGMCGESELDD